MEMSKLNYKQTKFDVDLCQYDMVVIFSLAEKLVPKRRKILNKALIKLPSRIIFPKKKVEI